MQLKVAGLEHLGVADMDIRLSRAGLDSEVRSDGRNGRIGFVFYDRADERDFTVGIIGSQQLLIGRHGLLSACRKGKRQRAGEYESQK